MALTKAQEKKIGTHGFSDFDPAEFLEDDRSIFTISIFRIEANAAGDGLRNRSANVQIRSERGLASKALKLAKATVKELNAGTFDFDGKDKVVISVPTGRKRGRPALVAA